MEIKFGEICGPLQQLKSCRDEGERVPVPDCNVIEAVIVNAGSEGLIFLLYEENSAPAGEEEGQMIPAARESFT